MVRINPKPKFFKNKTCYSFRFKYKLDDGSDWKWSKTRKCYGNKEQADKAAADYFIELRQKLDYNYMTLNVLCDEFCEDKKLKIQEQSYKRLNSVVKIIRNYLGDMLLPELEGKKIYEQYKKMSKDKISLNQLKRVRSTLNSILEYAVDFDYINKNPCKKANKYMSDIKGVDTKRTNLHFSMQQLTDFIKGLKKESLDGRTVAAWIGFCTGARIGEILGLDWNKINFAKQELTIDQQYNRENKITQTKTKYGARIISIAPNLIKILSDWQAIQKKQFNEANKTWTENTPVCTNALLNRVNYHRFHRWCQSFYVRNHLGKFIKNKYKDKNEKIIKKHYQGLDFHGLRRAQQTLLANQNKFIMNPKVLQGRAGHADINTTLQTYANYQTGADREAAIYIDNLIK